MRRSLRLLAVALTSGISTISAQNVAVSFLLGSEAHQVDAGFGKVTSAGWIPGASVAMNLTSRIGLQAGARSGTLNATAGATDDEHIAEVSALVQVSPAGWVSFDVSGDARSVTTQLSRQHWTTAGLGADLRMPLIGSATEGYVRLNVPFVVDVSGLAAPNVAVEGAAGLRYRQGRFLGQLWYDLRRFDFPAAGGRTRLEEISALTFGVGVLLGH